MPVSLLGVSIINTFISIIITIFTFGILILVHEFGHYIVAKKCGIGVNEFSIGMGPTIFKKQGKETTFYIKALPIGGFCKMEGEDEDAHKDNHRAFGNKTKLQRIAVLLAGAAMNILVGFIIVLIINCFVPAYVSTEIDKIGLPEQTVLKEGDKIVSIDGYAVMNYMDLNFAVSNIETEQFDAKVIRNGERIDLENIPLIKTENGYKMGINLLAKENTLGSILKNSVTESISIIRLVWKSVVYLVTGRVGVNELSGPVGITVMVQQTVEYGALSVLNLIAFIALNLGVMNLLPIPALDGGRIFMIIVEAIIRRPIPQKYESVVHLIGFILLMGLTVFVFINDIIKVFK